MSNAKATARAIDARRRYERGSWVMFTSLVAGDQTYLEQSYKPPRGACQQKLSPCAAQRRFLPSNA